MVGHGSATIKNELLCGGAARGDPRCVARNDGVDLDEHLARTGDHDFAMGFAGSLQALIQRLDGRIPAEGCGQAGGIESATHRSRPPPIRL